jgi:roadblock/LC7 domain-containing protein
VQLIENMTEEMAWKMLAANQMATDKLAEGYMKFTAAQDKCAARIAEKAVKWGMALV